MGAGPPRMFYGWIVLTCVSTVLLVTDGVQYAFGGFVTAMLHDLCWSRASLAGPLSADNLPGSRPLYAATIAAGLAPRCSGSGRSLQRPPDTVPHATDGRPHGPQRYATCSVAGAARGAPSARRPCRACPDTTIPRA